jgi:carboxypeptidase family protein
MPVDVCVSEHAISKETRLAAVRRNAYLLHLPMFGRPRECTLAATVATLISSRTISRLCSYALAPFFLAISIWSFAPTATAQRGGGVSVIGSVVDQTGAVLPSAQVELRSETGTVQSAAANQDGEFTFIAVASGRYTVVASFDGFQTTSVRLTVGARAPSALRITLPPATLTQEVTVGNAAADVRADATSNLDASTVDQRTLENLPVFNDDVVGTMLRFLDSTSIGTNGVMLIVNGVEVNSLTLPASAIQQVKINQDPYAPDYRQPAVGVSRSSRSPGRRRIRARRASCFVMRRSTRRMLHAVVERRRGRQNISNPYRRGLVSGTVTHQQGKKTAMVFTGVVRQREPAKSGRRCQSPRSGRQLDVD